MLSTKQAVTRAAPAQEGRSQTERALRTPRQEPLEPTDDPPTASWQSSIRKHRAGSGCDPASLRKMDARACAAGDDRALGVLAAPRPTPLRPPTPHPAASTSPLDLAKNGKRREGSEPCPAIGQGAAMFRGALGPG